jgi:hypothetical protein
MGGFRREGRKAEAAIIAAAKTRTAPEAAATAAEAAGLARKPRAPGEAAGVAEGPTPLTEAASSTEAEGRGGAVQTVSTSTSSVATPSPRSTPRHGRTEGSRPGKQRAHRRQGLVLVMVSTVSSFTCQRCELCGVLRFTEMLDAYGGSSIKRS